ncbi:MAG TPA: hypothetical protein VIC85_01415 [Ktedonobacterales bacterium]
MRQRRMRAFAVVLATVMSTSLALGGCANGGTGTTTMPPSTLGLCASPTAGGSVARPSGGARVANARVVPVSTLPPGVTIGQVAVVVESGTYGRASSIPVWAGNGLSQCIYTMDHQSDCSVVTLELRVNGEWRPQARCLLASPTRILGIAPLRADFVMLTPAATGAASGMWTAGTYRVAFTYRPSADGSSQPVEVDSDPFVIG